jgi:hypothetical protein
MERRTDPPRLGKECGRGVAMGGASGLLLAAIAGASPAVALLAVLGGCAAGALIGVLLWSGSDAAPEDRVPPPKTG